MLPLVVTVEDSRGLVRRHAFAESPVRLGRSPLNDLQLDEPFVSRWQSVLRFDENEITYFNVGSTNATRVNGVPAQLHEEMVVDETTTVSLGTLKIRFERRPVPDSDLYRKGARRQVGGAQEAPATEAVDVVRASELLQGMGRLAPPSLGEGGLAFGELGAGLMPSDGLQQGRVPLVQARPAGLSARATTKDPQEDPEGAVVGPGKAAAPPSLDVGFGFERSEPSAFAGGGATGSEPSAGAAPLRSPTDWDGPRPARAEQGPWSEGRPLAPAADVGAAGVGGPGGAKPLPAVVMARYAAYRSAWERFFIELKKELGHLPPPLQRRELQALQARFPDMTHEPAFASWLQQIAPGEPAHPGGRGAVAGVRAEAQAQDGDIDAWFVRIADGLMPRGFLKHGPGLPVSRVLSLLELLVESFVEFHGAQEAVRKHWFGLAARDSLLKAEEPRAVLVYLLNPKAEWEARVGELRRVVQELVAHELALFNATMVGARTLAERFSPEQAATEEGVKLEAATERRRGGSVERRVLARLRDNFRELMEGERYQRVFLGRAFARTYLAAMGRRQEEKNG